jgi:hypothetical protein
MVWTNSLVSFLIMFCIDRVRIVIVSVEVPIGLICMYKVRRMVLCCVLMYKRRRDGARWRLLAVVEMPCFDYLAIFFYKGTHLLTNGWM